MHSITTLKPGDAGVADASSRAASSCVPDTRHATIALLLVLLVAWFASLELRGLFIPDEGRYAEIPREMLDSGDWITPRLNGLKYFEKPPMQYWLTAASFAAFGEDEWTARLPSTLLGFLAVVMTAFTARRLWGARALLTTGVVLGSSWAYYLSGQYLTLDIMVSAFLTFALCGFLLAQREGATPVQASRWMLFAWAAGAFAMLSKGLIGLALPGLALAIYMLVARDFRLWRRLEMCRGFALLLTLLLPWFVLVQHRNPEFFDFFFVHEHWSRFAGSDHARRGAWWYYAPILVMGLMPWTPLFIQQWLRSRAITAEIASEVAGQKGFQPMLFCAVWAVAIIVFFSVSQSKLPAYVIPVFPALALLLGKRAALDDANGVRWCAITVIVVGGALTMASTQLAHWEKFADIGDDGSAALPLIYAATLSLVVAGVIAMLLLRHARTVWAVFALVAGSFLFWSFSFVFLHNVDTAFSSERLIEALGANIRPFDRHHEFYSIGQFDHSLPFYLGRTVTLVDYAGELRMGQRTEPARSIETIAEFARVWRQSSQQAYAVMRPQQYAQFQRDDLPMTILARDRRLVVVGRWIRHP